MPNNSKKPITISLIAALIICFITFIIGFFTSSVVLLDSRLESAQAEITELENALDAKDIEIDNLNTVISQKNESNIILAETISDHLDTIDTLTEKVSALENDVNYVSEVALQSENFMGGSSAISALSLLTTSQQLIMLVVLFVIIIFIISVTCGLLATKSKSKRKPSSDGSDLDDTADTTLDSSLEDSDEQDNVDTPSSEEVSEDDSPSEEVAEPSVDNSKVSEAIELLYANKLEDCISDLGAFRFGITNFNDILSDRAKGKSFGVVDNGDFVAFMSQDTETKKLYIIPRYMALSDSTVALRGVTDLFNVSDEDGNVIDHGTVKIKSIDAPAVFAFGEKGWAIESKGIISAYGKKTFAQ